VSTRHHEKQAYEARPDWAFCYPNRKRQEWMSDFCSVIALSATGSQKYWVNVWEHHDVTSYFVLRLTKKDDGAQKYSTKLRDSAFHRGRFIGSLAVDRQQYRVALWEEDSSTTRGRYLRVHFELERSTEQ
jgi:hypothetical protein